MDNNNIKGKGTMTMNDFIFLPAFHERVEEAKSTEDLTAILDWVFEQKKHMTLPMYSVYQFLHQLDKHVLRTYAPKLTGDDAAYLESALIFFSSHTRHFQ